MGRDLERYRVLTFPLPDDDVAELNCICSAANANTIIPTCDACVAQFDVPDRDNDKDDKDDKNDKTPDMHGK